MILDIQKLSVVVEREERVSSILDGIDLKIAEKELAALVGGSGSGKTTTGLAVLRLLEPGIRVSGGNIFFEGTDLLSVSEPDMRDVRGRRISMVFQDPLSAFNPVFSIGYQIDEVMRFHTGRALTRIKARTMELLDLTGIPGPQRVYNSFPHQLSGGLRQRAMIAMAIALKPRLIIADEPTSNLDVTLQARIMELFRKLRRELEVSFLLITHDLGIVRHLADRVYVMRGGKIVEYGAVPAVLDRPSHEYTRKLLKAVTV